MPKRKIFETERLYLREFDLSDANFILKLVNIPTWLEFIGDKNVKSKNDAERYLKDGPLKSYQENGFGLWLVQLKDSRDLIGMCGLVNRETLENVDIGFAILPEYTGLGYGFEAANATMSYAKNSLNLEDIVAITDPKNIASIKLLNKIGFKIEKTLKLSEYNEVLLLSEK